MPIPVQPKIYHITHVENLPKILAEGGLWSDAAITRTGGPTSSIGFGHIKQRRLSNPVSCHPESHVGDYVPFYYCSRSVMLYLIHCANDPHLAYKGGQAPIIHLEFDLRAVGNWAKTNETRWAIALGNAGAYTTEFTSDSKDLQRLDWNAIASSQFSSREVKDAKQAEFLVHDFVPWRFVERIGVQNQPILTRIRTLLTGNPANPPVELRPDWYF